jgi:heme-degrading monooxygenase HmoA
MHARVWHLRILPEKLEEFKKAIRSLLLPAYKQGGFCGVVVLRGDGDPDKEAMVIAVWDSLEQLKASERNLFLYQAIARILGCCEAFPTITEREVLLSEFAAG